MVTLLTGKRSNVRSVPAFKKLLAALPPANTIDGSLVFHVGAAAPANAAVWPSTRFRSVVPRPSFMRNRPARFVANGLLESRTEPAGREGSPALPGVLPEPEPAPVPLSETFKPGREASLLVMFRFPLCAPAEPGENRPG